MKKATCLGLAALLCFLLAGCESVLVEPNNELESQYAYYSNSVTELRNEMNLTPEQADTAFEVLVQCGLDDEINYIYDKTDENGNAYYDVWYGTKCFEVYLSSGKVETVKQYRKVLYPVEGTSIDVESEKAATEISAPATNAGTDPESEKITITEAAVTKERTTRKQAHTTTEKAPEKEYTVILNTSTNVYHLRECQAAKKIKAENRSSMTGTIAEIEAAGYRLCGICAK